MCGLIGFNAGKLTGSDLWMRVNLTSLLDSRRGGAWPSSARTVGRSLKCDNERDPHLQLQLPTRVGKHFGETASAKLEEGGVDGRSVRPESPGLHAHYKGQDNALQPRKGKLIAKPVRS